MSARGISGWLRSSDGSASVEFVVIFLALVSTMFFVLEITLYLFFMASVEKAAQAGLRAAVVSQPVVAIPMVNDRDNTDFGEPCGLLNGDCENTRWSRGCGPLSGGGACSGASFDRILQHMRKLNANIQAGNVSVSYEYAGAGFAGGPAVPIITVTVSGVPFQAGILGLLLRSAENQPVLAQLATLPTRSASMTGEDLAQ
jgi:hypothetical protein